MIEPSDIPLVLAYSLHCSAKPKPFFEELMEGKISEQTREVMRRLTVADLNSTRPDYYLNECGTATRKSVYKLKV